MILHDGEYIITHTPMWPALTYYVNYDIIKYDYDLEKAKEWLLAAGYDVEVELTTLPILTVLAMIGAAAFCLRFILKRKDKL
ncbi:MAG: hypothetical protein ACXABK_02125 [Candidatus Heimdallarchaeaceae archaeon]|jgi:ABC-type transport system substrate-binding protein